MKLSSKRETIIKMHRAECSNSKIAKSLSVDRSTVWRTLKQYKERDDFEDWPRKRRPQSQQTLLAVKVVQE